MIPELGNVALIIALCFAVLLAALPLLGASRANATWMRLGRPLAAGHCFFILLSFAILVSAFLHNDFSVMYVANNSSRELPWFYRLCAVWGGHEGSMLLWVMILSVWTLFVSRFSRHLPLRLHARILGVLGLVSIGFLLFSVLTSNPFLRLLPNIPSNGRDLNPLLQDIGFVMHPPMLYMGYVGFAVVFAFAVAALLGGHFNRAWARWARPWTLLAWSFLTLGITLGSWWAYRELGWGGWWFWDPVENASFMPWLAGTALLHSLIVTEKQNQFKAWTLLLSIVAFCLSLLGTFLVRSGVLTSVHAFAQDPTRGAFMLLFLCAVVAGSLFLYAWRAQRLRSQLPLSLLSREALLFSNNVLLFVAMLTVLLGTLYPLVIDALGLGKLSVGAPYFNAVFIPLLTPVLILMGLGPHAQWRQFPASMLMKRLRYTMLVSVSIGLVLPWVMTGQLMGHVVLGISLACWVLLANLQSVTIHKTVRQVTLAQWGMVLAHVGVAITVVGITLSSAYSIERHVRMSQGDVVTMGDYAFIFEKEREVPGPNYKSVQVAFRIQNQQRTVDRVWAEKRIYTVQRMPMTEAAVSVTLWRDLYVALGEPLEGGAWAVRLYYKPFIRWIWLGGLWVLLGGLFAFFHQVRRAYQAKPVNDNNEVIAS